MAAGVGGPALPAPAAIRRASRSGPSTSRPSTARPGLHHRWGASSTRPTGAPFLGAGGRRPDPPAGPTGPLGDLGSGARPDLQPAAPVSGSSRAGRPWSGSPCRGRVARERWLWPTSSAKQRGGPRLRAGLGPQPGRAPASNECGRSSPVPAAGVAHPLRRHRSAGSVACSPPTAWASRLWRFGISGDRPIVLARIAEEAELSLVRATLGRADFLRHQGP